MSRLFITPKEVNFISDITKEVIKDIIAQRIFYFSINEAKTLVDEVYNEAPEKVFDDPIELECLVEWHPEKVSTNRFGSEETRDIVVFIQNRDLIDKGVNVSEGDFFSYGDTFYEVVSNIDTSNVAGEVEHKVGVKLTGQKARKSQFLNKVFGPTLENYSDADAVQTTFVQQRGLPNNKLGPTNDVRELQRNGTLDPPISGPREVSPRGQDVSPGRNESSFYDEDI